MSTASCTWLPRASSKVSRRSLGKAPATGNSSATPARAPARRAPWPSGGSSGWLRPEAAADLGQQLLGPVRLLDEGERRARAEAPPRLVAVVAGREDDAHAGVDLPEPAEGLLAAQPRHREVEQHDVDAVPVRVEEGDAPRAVFGAQHLEPLLLEDLADHVPDRLFVVDEEDPRLPPSRRRGRRGPGDGRLSARREEDPEGRPPPRRAVHAQRPPVAA